MPSSEPFKPATSSRTARRAAWTALVCLAVGAIACDLSRSLGLASPRVRGVGAEFYELGDFGGNFLPSGDTATLHGVGYSDGLLPRRVLDSFGSEAEARQFAWASSDPRVATVGPRGLVTTLEPGTTRIRVSAAGRTDTTFLLKVYPAVASVALEPESAVTSVAIGGSVRVRLVARDAQGREVVGVPLWPYSTDGKVAGVLSGSPIDPLTPSTVTFGGWQAGTTTITATTPHPRASGRRSAEVPLTVTDPGTAPDTLPRATADRQLRVTVGRSTLRRGDTTTVRVVLYNRGTTALRFSASASCALGFKVVYGNGVTASPLDEEKCSAAMTFAVAAGDSLVRSTLWRADDGTAAAVPLTPGLYWISALGRGEPDLFAVGSRLAIRVLP